MKAQIVAGIHGMPEVILEHDSGSRAEIYLNGAHVTSWIPAHRKEMLFVSDKALFAPGNAIRGGIPVVFPQFAENGPLPKHGWLRSSEWKVRELRSASVTLEIEENATSLALWPHPYHVELMVTVDEKSLDVGLRVQNPGAEAFGFTSALHTYLRVADVRAVQLTGLENIEYIDKVKGGVVVPPLGGPITIDSETDRIYRDGSGALSLRNSAGEPELEITSSGYSDVVVWNPWIDATRGILDMNPDDYLNMLCVEAAAAVTPVVLDATESWSGSQRLTVV